MTGRGVLYLLLAVVAGAAAMLSFAALRDLALRCGFEPVLAWLLPVAVDAGAASASGSVVWLREGAGEPARRFARRLALGLLALSVAANALGHGLAAFVLLPPWWVVVVLSGIAPAVLGAMGRLAVLVGRPIDVAHDQALAVIQPDAPATDEPAQFLTCDMASSAPASKPTDDGMAEQGVELPDGGDRAAALIAAGAGRRRLSRELGLTEYEARRLLERTRPVADASSVTKTDTSPDTGAGPAEAAWTGVLVGARS
ncbi:DUF2637 domain-containing protein [Pseudonocardia charpentierae]|uniref:DUF2637 domain-containing protein n=1 Tax=Pseudonocardia charpentierae TaxID=3075545 RepID=A0ABU2N2J5_9PSEU|nr:DUF2637 domain-containing protein [Pseudonocardia sp. DSM 45834]MDT0348138.1 DUF2637 domain-containing protein [Pseudonocardia sp. DSM 45834]